jgi:membrane protein YqaA with SNARE-associated domain
MKFEKDLIKIIIQSLIGIVVIIGIVILLGKYVRQPLESLSIVFVDVFGYIGLFLGMILSDSLPLFIPPDAFLMLAISGNLSTGSTILYCSAGSILGGSLAFAFGKYVIPNLPIGRSWIMKHEHTLVPYVRKYGVGAVILAALTPIPYSWMAYTVGTFHMNYGLFLMGSMFRILRFTIYYYAILGGWVV